MIEKEARLLAKVFEKTLSAEDWQQPERGSARAAEDGAFPSAHLDKISISATLTTRRKEVKFMLTFRAQRAAL